MTPRRPVPQPTIDELAAYTAAMTLGNSSPPPVTTALGGCDENCEPSAYGHAEKGLVVEIVRNGEQNIVLLQVQMKSGQNGVVRVGKNPVSDTNDVCVSLACGDEVQPNNYMKWVLLFGDGTTKSCVEVSFDHGKPGDSMFYRPGQSFMIDKSLTGYVREWLKKDEVVSQSGAPAAASTRDAVMVSGSEDEDEDEVEEKDEDTEVSSSDDGKPPVKSSKKEMASMRARAAQAVKQRFAYGRVATATTTGASANAPRSTEEKARVRARAAQSVQQRNAGGGITSVTASATAAATSAPLSAKEEKKLKLAKGKALAVTWAAERQS
jgi:hypothetical protein